MRNLLIRSVKENTIKTRRNAAEMCLAAVRLICNKRSQLLWFLGPALSFAVMEYLIGNLTFFPFSSHLSWLQVGLNLIWYYMFAGFVFLLAGRRSLSAGVTAVIFWLLANVEHYVYQFRWRVIFPSDLLAAGTALSVADNYNFKPSTDQYIAAAVILAYLVLLILMPRQKKRQMPRPWITMLTGGLAVTYIAIFAFTPFLNAVGLGGEIWESMWDTKRNGILLNFTINLKNTRVEKPEGYSMEAVKTLADSTGIATTDYSKPNVIVIMNEAFSDLSVLGDVKTNTDSLPFIHSLTENTVKGYAYSSVFGGHTANSEYEFITGNTMAFLPSGTVAYQMYVENGDYNLGSQFKSLGYNTTFMHPYYSSGWNRKNVYQDFGFDNVLFQNQFWGTQYIRKYVSDKSDYQNLIRNYETNSRKGPVFMFNVTMQNHGGYSKERENLDESVYLTGDLEEKFENADTYLSLMHETDSAFKGLVDYFSKIEKPTVILMFGDHQPDLGDSFYEKIFGKSQDSLTMDESSKKYKIPFVIWANYDIKEQSGIETSINYLSTLLMKTAGLPLTGYQEFLSEVSDRIPVITNINFREEGGTMTNKTADLSEESQKLLNDYRILQYNGINDKKNRLDKLFFLSGDNMINAYSK